MSKKRFVEFYLAAMMKAQELVVVTFNTGCVVPTDVAGLELMEIAKAVMGVLK